MDREKVVTLLSRLEEFFMETLRRLHLELAQHMVSGVTGGQFFVLKKINDRGSLTVSEVAGELGVSLSAITALADRLYKAGLVERRRDEKDRRLVWLELTREGRRVVGLCQEGRQKVAVKYFGQLPDEDLERLVAIFEKLIAIVRSTDNCETGEVK